MTSEEKIIEDIRDQLLYYEIPYEERRWEDFQKQYGSALNTLNKKKDSKLIPVCKYAAAVAAATIFIIVVLFWPEYASKNKEVVKQDQKKSPVIIKPNDVVTTKEKNIRSIKTGLKNIRRSLTIQPASGEQLAAQNSTDVIPEIKDTLPDIKPGDKTIVISRSQKEPDTNIETYQKTPPFSDHDTEKRSHTGRWKFGVEVNPSLVSDRVNLGVGISTQYEISQRIKLSAGLSYSSITADHNINPVQISTDTNMIGGQSVIKAIDIPFSIIYEQKQGWYAAVGVSALAVLKENKVYEFESKRLQETFSTDPDSGNPVSVFKMVESHYSEKSTDTDFKGRNNLGYLNIAVGKQYKFYSDKKILLEPFVKIPMGGLNNNNVNLLNSGIKIKLLF